MIPAMQSGSSGEEIHVERVCKVISIFGTLPLSKNRSLIKCVILVGNVIVL